MCYIRQIYLKNVVRMYTMPSLNTKTLKIHLNHQLTWFIIQNSKDDDVNLRQCLSIVISHNSANNIYQKVLYRARATTEETYIQSLDPPQIRKVTFFVMWVCKQHKSLYELLVSLKSLYSQRDSFFSVFARVLQKLFITWETSQQLIQSYILIFHKLVSCNYKYTLL